MNKYSSFCITNFTKQGLDKQKNNVSAGQSVVLVAFAALSHSLLDKIDQNMQVRRGKLTKNPHF